MDFSIMNITQKEEGEKRRKYLEEEENEKNCKIKPMEFLSTPREVPQV
jgi:hypothetical protein